MSSLEMLTLLELAQGRPASPVRAEPQPSPVLGFLRQQLRWLGVFGQRWLLLVALLSVWEAAPRLGLIDQVFLPPFSEVIAAGWQLAQSGELYEDVSASLLRALSGFLISVVLIVPLGLVVGWYARLGNLLNQFIEIAATPHRLRCCRCSSCCSGLANCRRSRWLSIAAPGRCCSTPLRRSSRSIRC